MTDRMRVVFVVHHFPPDVNSTGTLMSGITQLLRQRGHDVEVITSFPHYEGFRVWPRYRHKILERDVDDGVAVWRVWCFANGRKSMRNRLINYVTFNLMATVIGLWVARDADVVFATNGSFFTGISAAVIGRGRVPFILNVQDLYPEVPILAGQLRNPFAIRLLRNIARFMYRRATAISVISPALQRYLHEMYAVESERSTVIANFVDTERIRPLPRANPYAAQLGFVDSFVVAHSGNLGYAYDLMTLVDAANLLSSEDDLMFAIIGNGVLKSSLEARVRELNVGNVRFLGFQPHDALPWLRASIDLHVALYRPGAARYSMPSKLYEIMASGRPVLASAEPGSDVQRLIEASGGGVCIAPSDPNQLAQTILRLRDDQPAREAMGRLGRGYVEQHHTIVHIASQYEQLLARMAGTKPRSREHAVRREGSNE